MHYDGTRAERAAQEEVMGRASEIAHDLEERQVDQDEVTVAALAFLAALCAQRNGIDRAAWGELAQAAWQTAQQRIARAEW